MAYLFTLVAICEVPDRLAEETLGAGYSYTPVDVVAILANVPIFFKFFSRMEYSFFYVIDG